MSTLKVLIYPHDGLRLIAPPVTQFDEALRTTIQELMALVYQEQCVGLAATQVGLPLRLFAMDASPELNQPLCFINPVIIAKEGETLFEEGCMSFPGVYIKVKRASKVTVQYQDERGQTKTYTGEGVAAECIQHELDHLNGVLFIDYLSKLKRMMALKKLEKNQRLAS
jgi:peptide deformylase